jgi:hypothetical protein
MENTKCLACGQEISSSLSDSSIYCYKHKQVYDSFIAEYKALINAYGNNASTWKEFLLKKLGENKIYDDVQQIINAELKIAG